MTRIVAGLAKGRRLAVPPKGTRPTSERAREALFNTLRSHLDIEGAQVLDLYAGTGAVGLEALSRGAASVSFVESERAAADVVRRNIETVGLPGATLHRRPVAVHLATTTAAEPRSVDLAFLDPPYALAENELAEVLTALVPWLAEQGSVVVERAARGAEPQWPPGIALVTSRRYGEGRLWYGRAHHGA